MMTTPPQASVSCAYCGVSARLDLPENYAPRYADCPACGKRFIVERVGEALTAHTQENAPCCSDPHCREIELGAGNDE